MNTMRFMTGYKPEIENDVPPSPEKMASVGQFVEEIMRAGVLIATNGPRPSSQGLRARISGNKFLITDGPFAETKELIGG